MIEYGLKRAAQLTENENRGIREVAIALARVILIAAGVVDPQLEIKTEAAAPIVGLRQKTYELLHFVVEPTNAEKEALRASEGLVFLPMTPQSYAEIVIEDPGHFWDNEIDYVIGRSALQNFVPPVAVEVGLRETDLALPDSFNKSRAVALQMIEDYSQEVEREFPGFKAIMLPVTGYTSTDRAYSRRNPGKVLFKNCFAWSLDDFSEVRAAGAGRCSPSGRFDVGSWSAGSGGSNVGVVPAVVKISG